MGVGAQDAVDEVNNVCAHHRDLVDDDELQALQEFDVVFSVFKELADAPAGIA